MSDRIQKTDWIAWCLHALVGGAAGVVCGILGGALMIASVLHDRKVF